MYHQIARNKRKSVFVIVGFFAIWAAIGYLIGFIAGGVSGGIAGVIIAAIAAALVVLWSVTAGAQSVLALSGAQEVTQQQAPVLYDVVSTLAIGRPVLLDTATSASMCPTGRRGCVLCWSN